MAAIIGPLEVKTKTQKIIEMMRDKAIVQDVYFNPMFVDRLADKVPELRTLNFNLSKTETESEDGTVIAGKVVAPTGGELNLGSVLLDGKNVIVQKSLVPIDKFLNFIEENTPEQF